MVFANLNDEKKDYVKKVSGPAVKVNKAKKKPAANAMVKGVKK